MSRKVLYSPGFGAGWTSWGGGLREHRAFMLEHPGLIAAVEASESTDEGSPAMAAFVRDWRERFPGVEPPYLGGGDQLCVGHVPDGKRVRVDEYDGNESLTVEGDDAEEWL